MIGFVLTLGLWRFYRRWPVGGFSLTQHVPTIIFACVSATALDIMLTEICRRGIDAPPLPEMAQFGGAFIRFAIYGAWTSLYFGLRQEIQSRATSVQLASAIAANREAELQLLRAQLSPDFFLHGLDTILIAARSGNTPLVVETTQGVADYLRYTLGQATRAHYAPLGRELDAMTGYLRVEQARLGANQLDWHVEATKESRLASAPAGLIQPLIENAINHGLRSSPPPLRLSVEARMESGELVLCVENSGLWLEPTAADAGHPGHSLDNLRRRLALLYERHAQITVTTPAGLVRVEVRLPVAGV
jgi:LytS/YehU family sensor histidine kinase